MNSILRDLDLCINIAVHFIINTLLVPLFYEIKKCVFMLSDAIQRLSQASILHTRNSGRVKPQLTVFHAFLLSNLAEISVDIVDDLMLTVTTLFNKGKDGPSVEHIRHDLYCIILYSAALE